MMIDNDNDSDDDDYNERYQWVENKTGHSKGNLTKPVVNDMASIQSV